MPAPRWFQRCRQGARFGGHCAITFGCWTLWLALGVLAAIQIHLASVRELQVPGFALRRIESRLAEAGLVATFGRASFDPAGAVVLRDVGISLGGLPEPVVRADLVVVELDAIALWLRRIEPRRVRISGADLLLPAMLSPSGASLPLVDGLELIVAPGTSARRLVIEHLTARVGDVDVAVTGDLHLPAARDRARPPLDQLLAEAARHYVQACRTIGPWLARLPTTAGMRLDVQLAADPDHLAVATVRLQADRLALGLPGHGPVSMDRIQADTRLHLTGPPRLVPVRLRGGAWSGPGGLALEAPDARLELLVAPAALRIEPRWLEFSARRIETGVIALESPLVRASLAALPHLQADVQAGVFGQPWRWAVDLDLLTRAGRIDFDGAVANEAVDFAGARFGRDLGAIVSWTTPPTLHGHVNLGPGLRPLAAEARLRAGAVDARGVALDGTSARVTWDGTVLRADRIVLDRGASHATGSYEMDTKTLDFRFLLRGRLDPPDINGWFRDWWPRFWSEFDFGAAPPDARVEVAGRWGLPLDTRVWVQAEARDAAMRGLDFARVRTHLFVRPGWVDVLDFNAVRAAGEIRGTFARQWHMPDARRWTRVELQASGRTDLAPAPALLGESGRRLIEPFTVAGPLDLTLQALVRREDFGAPVSTEVTVRGRTEADWTINAFPLQGAVFSAHQTDSRLVIDELEAGLARGRLTGRVELSGDEPQRQLAFDLDLDGAHLGETLRTVETWTAARRGEAAAPANAFHRQIADGVLDLSLTAEGPLNAIEQLQGLGSAAIVDAPLGDINLFGILSSLLDRTLLSFSTLHLDRANGDFALNGRELNFSQVKLSGTRGALDARGRYHLDTQALDFTTRIRPFEGGSGLLDSFLSPLSSVLEVRLEGRLDDPRWTFVYGPTSLLRSLTGGAAPTAPSPPVTAPEAPPPTTTTAPAQEPDAATPPAPDSPPDSP